MANDIYKENGFGYRNDYLKSLADNNGVDYSVVSSMAEVLGENEDFDELVTALEDFSIL